MVNIVKKWTETSLILKIIVGFIIGVILGLTVPQFTAISIIGEAFVSSLKAIAPLLVFVLVSFALFDANDGIGNRFQTVIILYMGSTLLSSIVAVTASFLFPLSVQLKNISHAAVPSGFNEIIVNMLLKIFENPLYALAQGDFLGILFWAIMIGICLRKVGSETTKNVLGDLADAISMVVGGIIQFAPIGIMSLVFSAVSQSGLIIFVQYSKLILLLVGCIAVVAFIGNLIIIAAVLRRNPYPLVITCLRESGITAFFTRSSAANIPVNLMVCKKLGLDEDFYSISIPLGATINNAGAAVTITVMTLAVCHTLGIVVDLPTALLLCTISTITACGTSGVAGGSLLLIPLACSLFGIPSDISMQAVAIGFIIGVIQDSAETALNSSSDALFTATSEYYERAKDGKPMNFLGDYAKEN